jgi:hypothetical protein
MTSFGGLVRGLARRDRLTARPFLPGPLGDARGRLIGRACQQHVAATLERRVIVKVRCVPHGAKDVGRLGDHLRYLQREGVSSQFGPGGFYGRDGTALDPSFYRQACRGDPQHYRIIVSPEDANRLIGLENFVRDLMLRVEADLGAELDWLAVDHYNTGLPHSHIVLRGGMRGGGALIVAPAYLRHGLRVRACELVDRELGPVDRLGLVSRDKARLLSWTASDQCLASLARGGRLILPESPDVTSEESSHLVRRLTVIKRLGLTRDGGSGAVLLARDFEATMRALEQRGLLMALLQRELERAGLARAPGERVLWRPRAGGRPVVGEIVAITTRDQAPVACLVLDATDGRTYLAPLPGLAAQTEAFGHGMIVSLGTRSGQLGQSQSTHGKENPTWRIDIGSYLRLEAQATSINPTWLDQLIDNGCRETAPLVNFAGRVGQSLRARHAFLESQGILRQGGVMPPNLYRWLRARSLDRIAERIAERLGLDFSRPREGARMSGRLVGTLALPSERLAVLAGARRFTFLTSTPALERLRGQMMTVTIGRPHGFGRAYGLGLSPALAGR